MILLIVSVFLLIIYSALIVFYNAGWQSIPEFTTPVNDQPSVLITVIVAARNEAEKLPFLLQSLHDQFYPASLFEVIIVDDHSTDDTASIARNFKMPNIKVIRLSEHISAPINSYKKRALDVAISQAKGELIVTTDADCIVPVRWLQTIASFYEQSEPSLIVMPVNIECNTNFFEIFQSLDFMTLQGITGASVYKKFNSMCNGANLAYTKKSFYEAGGFTGIDNIASGDDMLLMHKIFKLSPLKIMYLKSSSVIVQTSPMNNIKDFLNQRIRWASKAGKYTDKRILPVLILVYLFNMLLFLIPVVAIFKQNNFKIYNGQVTLLQAWLLLLLCKTIIELYFLYPVAKFFNAQRLLFVFPLLQPFHIVYTVVAGWLGIFGTYTWKESKIIINSSYSRV